MGKEKVNNPPPTAVRYTLSSSNEVTIMVPNSQLVENMWKLTLESNQVGRHHIHRVGDAVLTQKTSSV